MYDHQIERRKKEEKEERVVWIDGWKSSDSAAPGSKGPLNGNFPHTHSYLRHFHSTKVPKYQSTKEPNYQVLKVPKALVSSTKVQKETTYQEKGTKWSK